MSSRPPAEVKRLTFDSGLALHPPSLAMGSMWPLPPTGLVRGTSISGATLPGGEPVRLTRDAAMKISLSSPDAGSHSSRNATDGNIFHSDSWEESRDCWRRGTSTRYSPDGQRLLFASRYRLRPAGPDLCGIPDAGRRRCATSSFGRDSSLVPIPSGRRMRAGFSRRLAW
jgi:hypothetical protein